MDTKVLEYIIAIADEKSISRAADRFFLSPSALSQHLKKIEGNLGANIFIRINGELCLTDVGKIFINGARSTLYIESEALSKIKSMRADFVDSIRIIVDERTAGQIKTNILPVVNRRLPQMEIKLIIGYRDLIKEYLINGMADMGIITSSYVKHRLLEFCPLHKDELVLVLPSSNRLVPVFEREGISWDALSSDYFIMNKMKDSFRSLQQEAMEKYRFRAQILCEVDTLHAVRYMVENGLGDALLPLSFLKIENPSYRIFHFNPPSNICTSALYPKATVLNKSIKELLNILREYFRNIKYGHSK
jgi:DNA-binding transcriptional LysR family regulator